MKKIDDLLSLDTGNYDTPKKLNRSEAAIPRAFVDQIEAGHVTSETLQTITAAGFPVFRYKTCITVHGLFDLASIPRIGGYKNLIQNQNGSLEIRYNAIDYDRKAQILREIRNVSEFGGFTDSRGTVIQLSRKVSTVEDANREKSAIFEILNRIKAVSFYGKACVFLANVWGQKMIVCEITLDAIKGKDVEPFLLAASGMDSDTLRERLADARREKEKRDAEYNAKRAEDQKEKAEIEAQRLELEKELAGKPAMPIAVGSRGAKAISLQGQVGFSAVRITRKGSFGRFRYEFTRVSSLDKLDTAVWKQAAREKKPAEIGNYSAV